MFSSYSSFSGLFYIAGLLLWLYPIWIYFDCKKWRRLGVPVYPGLVASAFALLNLAGNFLPIFGSYFYGYRYGFSYIPLLLLAYFFMREVRYRPISKKENAPLPPAPAWSKWLFILIFVAPIILGIIFIVLIIAAFRGGLGFYM